MHPRHRNPANGYRSNPIGIGGGGAVVAGGPGYRNHNRTGLGRGQPKIFQSGPPPPLPRRIDVFMEAGKLATEYLVSKGLLPPNSLSGKWPNGLKNQIGGGGGVDDAVSGTGGGRRRFPDDYSTARPMRTMGSFKAPVFESNREINHSSSWSEKVRGSSDKQGDDDSSSGYMEEQRSEKDGDHEEQKSLSPDQESTMDHNKQTQLPDDNTASLNGPSSDVSHECGTESAEQSDCSKNLDGNNGESEKPTVTENPSEENSTTQNCSDLLTLIRLNKVPTRTRSSLMAKASSRIEPVPVPVEEKKSENQSSGEPASPLPSDEKHDSEIQEAPSIEEVAELDEGETGRGEKRALDMIDGSEGCKKARDWADQTDDYSEEKQLFPGSFKICDLNLMEVSDVHENHNSHSVISFPSIRQPKQEPVSVDFDLSMSSSNRCGADGKEIEVIDLDCDSVQDDKVFSNSERKDETIFTDLESFPDSMQRVSDMPQDGYGLMISELLEADIPNSSVSTGVNSMHNDIGLRNEEGILGDDESIYMSLGEIPISFVPVWDQQSSQAYDKPY